MPVAMLFRRSTWQKPPLAVFPFRVLVVAPVLLAALTAWQLFANSDLNLTMLFSQCHSHARLPGVSRIPLLGPVLCYLISFFQIAVSSCRALAIMAAALAFVAGLLTVYTVEGARICNKPAVLIAYPTGPMLVFNLIGGAVVWELLIVPAFFHHHQAILAERESASPETLEQAEETHPVLGAKLRYFTNDAETVAIPAGVALGFILPSILLLVLDTPWAAGLWLFSPLYVSAIRSAVRRIMALQGTTLTSLHLESNRAALLGVYILPLAASALAHWNLIWSFVAHSDDRQEMARSVLRFVEVDIVFVGLTVLYWLFVEVGWQVTAVVVAISVVAGPGAGVCVGWIYREQKLVDGVLGLPARFVEGGDEERGETEEGTVDNVVHGEEEEEEAVDSVVHDDEEEGESSRRQADEATPLLG